MQLNQISTKFDYSCDNSTDLDLSFWSKETPICKGGAKLDLESKKLSIPRKNKRFIVAASTKASLSIAELWRLPREVTLQLVDCPDYETLDAWKRGIIGKCSNENILRMSLLLGIHAKLKAVFINPENILGWVHRNNADFGGKSPLDHMVLRGFSGMQDIRRYLAYWSGAF